MSNLSKYIDQVLKEGISPETARRAMEAYEAKHPTPSGIPGDPCQTGGVTDVAPS